MPDFPLLNQQTSIVGSTVGAIDAALVSGNLAQTSLGNLQQYWSQLKGLQVQGVKIDSFIKKAEATLASSKNLGEQKNIQAAITSAKEKEAQLKQILDVVLPKAQKLIEYLKSSREASNKYSEKSHKTLISAEIKNTTPLQLMRFFAASGFTTIEGIPITSFMV